MYRKFTEVRSKSQITSSDNAKKNIFCLFILNIFYITMYRQYTDLFKVTEQTSIYGERYWQMDFPVLCIVMYVKIYNSVVSSLFRI